MPSPTPPTALHFVLLLFSGWVNLSLASLTNYLGAPLRDTPVAAV